MFCKVCASTDRALQKELSAFSFATFWVSAARLLSRGEFEQRASKPFLGYNRERSFFFFFSDHNVKTFLFERVRWEVFNTDINAASLSQINLPSSLHFCTRCTGAKTSEPQVVKVLLKAGLCIVVFDKKIPAFPNRSSTVPSILMVLIIHPISSQFLFNGGKIY